MDKQIETMRNYEVLKSNALVQRTRYSFSPQQQKALLYIISQLKPEQKEFEYQTFDIVDFCRICGIDPYQGKNHKDLKDALQSLSDKSMWIRTPDGADTLVRWLSSVKIFPRNGKVAVRIDEEMKPYLLELKGQYTQYKLLYTLGMKSKYSIRLYELFKSLEKCKMPLSFDLDYFQDRVGSEYKNWYDIKRNVIEVALKEINGNTDISVSYQAETLGRRAVQKINFFVEPTNDFIDQALEK